MYEQNTCKNMKKGREEKTKFSKILPNNQIITTCCIELGVQEMTMNKKLTMTGLIIMEENLRMEENMTEIRDPKTFCFNFDFPKDVEFR